MKHRAEFSSNRKRAFLLSALSALIICENKLSSVVKFWLVDDSSASRINRVSQKPFPTNYREMEKISLDLFILVAASIERASSSIATLKYR